MNFSGAVEWLQSGGIYLSGGSDSLLSLSLGNDRGVTWYQEIPAAWHQGLSGSGQAPCSSRGTAAGALAFLLWCSVNLPIMTLKKVCCKVLSLKSAPNGSLCVHLNSLGEPLRNPTHSRTLRLLSFQSTLNVTLTITLNLKQVTLAFL